MRNKNTWTCFLLILAGIVLGGFIGSLFPDTWVNYGQTFGLSSPFVLDLGILSLTFGLSSPFVLDLGILSLTFWLTIKITIASIIGILLGIVIYRFL